MSKARHKLIFVEWQSRGKVEKEGWANDDFNGTSEMLVDGLEPVAIGGEVFKCELKGDESSKVKKKVRVMEKESDTR